MILEQRWQQWKKDKKADVRVMVEDRRAMVNFDEMVAHYKNRENGTVTKVEIRRSDNNDRKRPNGEHRHSIMSTDDISDLDKLKLLNSKDLEWLAWNWRIIYNQSMFSCKRHIIFGHYNQTIGLLPSPE